MKVTEFLLSEMNREVERSRRALQEVPTGKYDWKPHDKSMIFGYLTQMVATIPMWITMQIKNDELDVAPEASSRMKQEPKETSEALVEALDEHYRKFRLANTIGSHMCSSVAFVLTLPVVKPYGRRCCANGETERLPMMFTSIALQYW